MKKECAVVQDLLVLYEDDVLKEESRQMVEDHIRSCEACMQLYDSARKPLPVIEKAAEPSEQDQEGAAVRVLQRLKKRMTYKTGIFLGVVIICIYFAVILVDDICGRNIEGYSGLSWLFRSIPSENFHVAELYQLKNGDIYCVLESDKEFAITQVADWVMPLEEQTETTDGAKKELRFKPTLFWETNTVRLDQARFIFSLERQGTVTEDGKTKDITQSCADISVYGKTNKDKMTIWETGQKVEKAPTDIEEEAIRAYLEEGLYAKAVRECENMGWKDYEKVFGDAGLGWETEYGNENDDVNFAKEGNSIILY